MHKDAERLLGDLSRERGVTPEMVANLRSTISESPHLEALFSDAVEAGHLKSIGLMAGGMRAGALYYGESKRIEIPASALKGAPQGNFEANDLTFVLGHELQHGFNHAARQQAIGKAANEINDISRSRDPENAYDEPIAAWHRASAHDEARAHVEGWNSAVSRFSALNGRVTLASMLNDLPGRADDFVHIVDGKVYARPGIEVLPNMTLEPTPSNLSTLVTNYYQDPTSTVGRAASSYPNHTGASAIGYIVQSHRIYARPHRGVEPRLMMDMDRHGMDEEMLEINGIHFGRSADKSRQAYIDTSGGEERMGHFDHTADGPNQYRHVPITREVTDQLFDNPGHPSHRLHDELRNRLPAETSADRLAQITAATNAAGIRAGRVDAVHVQDDAVFVTGDVPGQRARIDLSRLPPDADESAKQVATESARQDNARQQAHEVAPVRERISMQGAQAGY